jgi:hypothetical protein
VANVHFQRKIVSEELSDTLYFSLGTRATRTRSPNNWTLTTNEFKVVIVNTRNITVNQEKCKSIPEAKYTIHYLAFGA